MTTAQIAMKCEPAVDGGSCMHRLGSLQLFLYSLSTYRAAALGISAAITVQQEDQKQAGNAKIPVPKVKVEQPEAPAVSPAACDPEDQPPRVRAQQPEILQLSSSDSYGKRAESIPDPVQADSSFNSGSETPLDGRLEQRQSLHSRQPQQQPGTPAVKGKRVSHDEPGQYQAKKRVNPIPMPNEQHCNSPTPAAALHARTSDGAAPRSPSLPAVAAAAAAKLSPKKRPGYQLACRVPNTDMTGMVRGYHYLRHGGFKVSVWRHGAAHNGKRFDTEAEAADAAWQLHLQLSGLPADTAAPSHVPETSTARNVKLNWSGRIHQAHRLGQQQQQQQQQPEKYRYYPRIPRKDQRGRGLIRGYSLHKNGRFVIKLSKDGAAGYGGVYKSEAEAADAAWRMHLCRHGLPPATPAPPLIPTSKLPARASVISRCYKYAYAPRVFQEGTPAKRGYAWKDSEQCFRPVFRFQGKYHTGDKHKTEEAAAHAAFKLYLQICGLPADMPEPPLLPAAGARTAGAAKKVKYPFAFAPRDFGHGYRPMRAYSICNSGGRVAFRPVIWIDGERHSGALYKSEKDAADAAWTLFQGLFKLPATSIAPPLIPLPRVQTVLKRSKPSSPAATPSLPKKRRLGSSSVPAGQARQAHPAATARQPPGMNGKASSNTMQRGPRYSLPPRLLGANGGLKRGYYNTATSAGTHRWVVDVQMPAAQGGAQLRHIQGVQDEQEAAEVAQQFYCEVAGMSQQRLQEEVAQRTALLKSCSTSERMQSAQQQGQPVGHVHASSNIAHQRSQQIILRSLHAKRKRQQQSVVDGASKRQRSTLQAIHRERCAPITRSKDQALAPARNICPPAQPPSAPATMHILPQQWQQLSNPEQTGSEPHAAGPDLTTLARPGLEQSTPTSGLCKRPSKTPSRDPRRSQTTFPVWPTLMQTDGQPAPAEQAPGLVQPPDQPRIQPMTTQTPARHGYLPHQTSMSQQPQAGAPPAVQADHGGSSTTYVPAAGSEPSADKAGMQRELEAVCEQLLDAAGCARAFEGVLQAKLRAAKRRAEDKAVEDVLDDVDDTSIAEIRQVLDQRRQDLVKMEAYVQGLNGVSSLLL